MRFIPLVCFLAIGLISNGSAADSSFLSLHPDNPHYFLWHGKPTVLITSGEHHGAVLNREFDYVRYLDELRAHGLSNTRTFSGVYREVPSSFGITDNPLAPKPGQYLCPWDRSDKPGGDRKGTRIEY